MVQSFFAKTAVRGGWLLLIVPALMLSLVGRSEASVLTLTSGATTITVFDGGAGDSNAAVGVITYIGAVGSTWSVNVSTGVTYPALGSPSLPELDLNSVSVSSSGAGSLTIMFSEVGFTGAQPAMFNLGGTTAGTVSGSTYSDAGNVLHTAGGWSPTLMHALGPFGPGAFAGSAGGVAVPGTTPYSLAVSVTMTHTGSGVSSFDGHLFVPEPGTIAIWSMLGLMGMGYSMQRRRV
jgi:hypothetical protein